MFAESDALVTFAGVALGGILAAAAGLAVALLQSSQATKAEESRRAHDREVRDEERRQARIEQTYLELIEYVSNEDNGTEQEEAALWAKLDAYGSYEIRLSFARWLTGQIDWRSARRQWIKLQDIYEGEEYTAGSAMVATADGIEASKDAQMKAAGDMKIERSELVRLVRLELGTPGEPTS